MKDSRVNPTITQHWIARIDAIGRFLSSLPGHLSSSDLRRLRDALDELRTKINEVIQDRESHRTR